MTEKILDIKKPVVQTEQIIDNQYHTYTPYTTSFNNNDEIRIAIQSQDLCLLPSTSYLHIEYTVEKPNVGSKNDGSLFSMNHLAHLFSEMRYEINGVEIDHCRTPGITTIMKTLLACKTTDKELYQLFTFNADSLPDYKKYRAILPLRFIFGFCDDYNKVVVNCKHELILMRSRYDICVYTSAIENLKFTVNKIHWKVQHVSLSDATKLTMLRNLEHNRSIPLAYRSWDLYELPSVPQSTRHNWTVKTTTQMGKPRYVAVAFQTNRNKIHQDSTAFDTCTISDVKLYINNERYPYDNLNLMFHESGFHELYHMLINIQKSYYNDSESNNPLEHTYIKFQNRPIFAFDCSKSDESIKKSMVDVRIEIVARENIPANTAAYCLIIHDNLVRYSPLSGLVHRDI